MKLGPAIVVIMFLLGFWWDMAWIVALFVFVFVIRRGVPVTALWIESKIGDRDHN